MWKYKHVPKKGNKLSVYTTINYSINKICREAFVAVVLISAACCEATASISVLIVYSILSVVVCAAGAAPTHHISTIMAMGIHLEHRRCK